MKKTKARAASAKKPSPKGVANKKTAPRSARTRSLSQQAVAAKAKAGQDGLVAALIELVQISIEIRELLAQIRDALIEGEEAGPAEVDTIVIAEAESPESSEDEF
jgi:hypothetical protein